jgi:hypothetical protein
VRRSTGPLLLALVALVSGSGVLLAQPTPGSPPVRTWKEQQALLGPTRAEELQKLRDVVCRGSHSGRPRLVRMFKNFDEAFALNPTTPGVRETVRLTASVNRNQVKGASRTIVYAQQLNQNSLFTLEGLNRPVKTPLGKTDQDIRYRHIATGKSGMIEVKDVSLASQGGNLRELKKQMGKHAAQARLAGELPPVWVNRYEVHPELKAHARKLGIPIYENIRARDFNRVVLEGIRREAQAQARVGAFRSGVQTGTGAVLLLYYPGRKGSH